MFLRDLWLPEKRLPHFLVLGTQKGGTTSLHKLLLQHPGVFLPPCKEVHYFSLHAEKPASWYEEHYKNAKNGQKRGDITPFYLFHPKAPERIYKLLPQANLIVLLRDPIERALSQYFHAKRNKFEPLELSDALTAEKQRLESGSEYSLQKHSYVARSRYLEQITRYEMLFPSKQILILKSENLFENTISTWQQIQKFLKLKQSPMEVKLTKANAGYGEAEQVDSKIRRKLKKELYSTAKGVKERYGIDWGWTE